jgi:endonuclease VIII
MPEGDTVFQAAARLHRALAGKTLTHCDVRVPRYATSDLSGLTVDEVVARGKHLLIRVGEYTVHSHLKMEGRWEIYTKGARWRRPAFKARIILEAGPLQAVGFELGTLEILRRADEDAALGHLGPDLLGSDWDADVAVANLSADPARPIGLALLDQRVMAGIGNVFRCEMCFLRRTHPAVPVADAGDLDEWVDLAKKVLEFNRNRSIRVTNVDRAGERTWVYGRAKRPCRRCGTAIRSAELGGTTDLERVIYWCPSCQPPP